MIHFLSNLAIIAVCNAIAVFVWIQFDKIAEGYGDEAGESVKIRDNKNNHSKSNTRN